jgi:hypothetical protein
VCRTAGKMCHHSIDEEEVADFLPFYKWLEMVIDGDCFWLL